MKMISSIAILVLAGTAAMGGTANRPSGTFREPKMQSEVSFAPKQRKLTEFLGGVSQQIGVEVRKSPSCPELKVFLSAPETKAADLLKPLPEALSDAEWVYVWKSRAPEDYVLYRRNRDPKKQAALERAATIDRLRRNLRALHSLKADPGDEEGRQLLSDQRWASGLQLAGALSQVQVNGVMAGHPIQVPVRSLSAGNQALVRAIAGHQTMVLGSTNQRLFDYHNIDQYVITVRSEPGGDPGLGASIAVTITNPASPLHSEVGVVVTSPDQGAPRSRVSHGAFVNPALARLPKDPFPKGDAASLVTVLKDAETEKKEPVCAAYLRSYCIQTRSPLLAYWPESSKAFDARLPESIIRKKPEQAVSTLSKLYALGRRGDALTVLAPKTN